MFVFYFDKVPTLAMLELMCFVCVCVRVHVRVRVYACACACDAIASTV